MKRLFPILAVAILIAGCADAGDIAVRTLENIARAACTAAHNCANVCPDGSTASPHTWSCPGRP
ncbi:MAG: hypothetical protein EXQ95_14380 [Alphaproteobacteria bacterium]|nr:hypothetical protein [Alphaproteobacteria bacterium]